MRPHTRAFLFKIHRWLSLAMMALWLIQALSGIVCVFHWEMDDATISAPARPLDLQAIDRRIALLAPPASGRTVSSIWTSAGAGGRWDISLDGKDGGVVRIDGAGNVLRTRHAGELFGDGGWIDTVDNLHQTLMAGPAGGWIVGLSGLLLLSNLVLALYAAWPNHGRWKRTLRPASAGPLATRLYGWHRAVGLWAALPALLVVTTGTLRVFSDGFEHLVRSPAIEAPPVRPDGRAIPFSRAAEAALAAVPGSRLAGIRFPATDDLTWRIRLLAPGEPRRAYGMTTVLIDGGAGHVLALQDARTGPFRLRLANLIYPIHTGEALGMPGRLGVLSIGVWLASMVIMGALLWWSRRAMRKRTR